MGIHPDRDKQNSRTNALVDLASVKRVGLRRLTPSHVFEPNAALVTLRRSAPSSATPRWLGIEHRDLRGARAVTVDGRDPQKGQTGDASNWDPAEHEENVVDLLRTTNPAPCI